MVLKPAPALADTLTVKRRRIDGWRLPLEYSVLRGVDAAGTGEPVEHLVVGPTGVFAVRSYVTTSFLEIASGRGWRDGNPVLTECERVAWDAIVTSDALDAIVVPVLCLAGTMQNAGVYRAGSTLVCGQATLPATICDRPRRFTRVEVAALVNATRRHATVS